ncbi:MAG: glycosyltransferase family 2 protein [Clostridia bacterium]|nr:glycosyltransferase family 2 protein [Clostridia bacterium]
MKMELTILMPCLNEEKTVGACIEDAQTFLRKNKICGEVLIADNGSTDRSVEIAKALGARVVSCREKGYGNALRTGIQEAYGEYVIFGDCDRSYDFLALSPMLDRLRKGAHVVAGDRFAKPPPKDAMSLSHRIGVRFLSWAARKRFRCTVHDFHCGLRGIHRQSVLSLNLRTEGMEFATELLARAAQEGRMIDQVPVTLRPDGRNGPSHIRTVRDGFRHLFFILKK